MSKKTQATVLVVDDDEDIVDMFSSWLEDAYDVRAATNGTSALETFDDSIDVVLLDRHMPDLTGDEVLETIRENDYDCRVAMVTAIEPDFSITDMAFDEYVVKPVTKYDLHRTVEGLVTRQTYGEHLQNLFALASKKAVLESRYSRSELESNADYAELVDRLEDAREKADDTFERTVVAAGFEGAFVESTKEADAQRVQ